MGVDKAYFVVGDQVFEYDIEADRANGEQWALSGAWGGLPKEFADGIDAAVDLGTFNLYVFRGTDYVRIPFGTQEVDDGPKSIKDNWRGLAFETVDAAMNWGDGKVYLFRGTDYARYDIEADRQDAGYPKTIAGHWTGVDAGWVGDGIDAAVNPGNGRAYFFKGTEYVVIDWQTKTQVGGPLSIAENWPGLGGPYDAAWTNAAPAPSGGGTPAGSSGAADFYRRYHEYAETSQTETGVPALVTLGQAALESGWGRHAPGNNFFGIKAKATDPPESRQLLRTREVLGRPDATFPEVISVTPRPDGRYDYVVRDWFRVYPSPAEAFIAHGKFLRNNSRYAPAFEHLDDPYEFARAVAAAGYATAPNYYDSLAARMREIEASR